MCSKDTTKKKMNIVDVECMLANLISRRFIKGYISHGKSKIVLDRRDPFPNLYKVIKKCYK